MVIAIPLINFRLELKFPTWIKDLLPINMISTPNKILRAINEITANRPE